MVNCQGVDSTIARKTSKLISFVKCQYPILRLGKSRDCFDMHLGCEYITMRVSLHSVLLIDSEK